MKKILTLCLTVMISIMVVLSGCSQKATVNDPAKKSTDAPVKKTVTIKDAQGNSIVVPFNPKKVVALDSSVAEIMSVLGEDDKIIGVSKSLKFPDSLTKKMRVGGAYSPNLEKIIELKPDIVFGFKDNVKQEIIDKIKAAGITYVPIEAYRIESLCDEIKSVGLIFNKEERANEYANFINKYLNLIKTRVATLKPEQKVSAYWELYTDYSSVAKNASGAEMMDLVGVNNIAENKTVTYPKLNDETIVQKNPQLVIRVDMTSKYMGYDAVNSNIVTEERKKIMNRTGWNKIDAVKNSKVYIIPNDIATTARSIVGICYLAKWSYPDLFKDLNPEDVNKELLKNFYNLDYKGYWVCP